MDVGAGVEYQLGAFPLEFYKRRCSFWRLRVTIAMVSGVPQVNDPKNALLLPVISKPDIDQKDVYQNLDLVKSVGNITLLTGGDILG